MSENRSLPSAITTYTEDDTFRILSRPSIHEMVKLHKKWAREEGSRYDTRKNIHFVNKYGWDWVEFLTAKKNAGYRY